MNTQEFKGAQTEEQLAMAAAAEPVSEKNLENGLVLTDIRIGEGPEAKPGQEVVVNYIGTFPDGTKFDTSYNHSPNGFEFPLGVGRVIQGWDQGVAGMRVGGLRKLIIPPTLGYGANDSGPIPGGSTLHFTVELLKVGGN